MSLLYRTIIAADLPSNNKLLFRRFRGKPAKEVYRLAKGVLITKSFIGPTTYAVACIPKELSTGFIYKVGIERGEAYLGYLTGLGFVRWIYKFTDVQKLKSIARVGYNILGLPLTIYSMGAGSIFDLIKVSELERIWFGSPVYIFDDNRLWIEKNFTVHDVLDSVSSGE